MAVPCKRDGPIVQPYRERLHRFQMSFGKLTLLSADCFGSGAMVGSSRMVADSSGTCGAPGAGGFLPWSAACVVRTTAPMASTMADVTIATARRILLMSVSLYEFGRAGTRRYCTVRSRFAAGDTVVLNT